MDVSSTLPQADHPELDDVAALDGDLLRLVQYPIFIPPFPADKKKGSSGKKKKRPMRKAPNAPRRFKSSYICFFMAKQPEIKAQLGSNATVANVSKRSAEMWKSLSDQEKAVWEDVAARDKARYNLEKAQYSGPWQVPWKRVKKDPTAPKRPMSAFLYFSQIHRPLVKADRPGLKNTEISKILGEMWRNLSPQEREPHVEKEREERAKYTAEMAAWRQKNAAEAVAQRKAISDHIDMVAKMPVSTDDHNPLFSDPFATAPIPGNMFSDPLLLYQRGLGVPTSPNPLSTAGKPIILGPTGMPHYASLAPVLSSHPAPAVFHDAPNPLSPEAFDFSTDQAEDSEV